MVTIILHYPHCGSQALVRHGHSPMANRRIALMPAAAAAARIQLPLSLQKCAARRSCMPPKNASLLRGLTRPFGVSGATGARWITKKERNFLPYGQHCWLRIPKSPLPRRWNWTNCAHWCSRKPTTPGSGSPCAERAVKSWRMPLGIAVGKTCQRLWEAIAEEDRQGQCKTRLFERLCLCHCRGAADSRGQTEGRKCPCRAVEHHAPPTRRLALSAGLSRFPASEIMLRPPVSCSSFIALLTIRLSFSREPLPVHAPWQALFQHFLHLVAQLVGLFAT